MSEAKELLKKISMDILDKANNTKIRFPKIYDDTQKIKEIAFFLLAKKTDDGGYDQDAAYQSLLDKYGLEESANSKKRKKNSDEKDKNNEDKDEGDESDTEGKPKKEKPLPKTQIFVNYDNQPVHDQLLEMSRYYFAQKEVMKGSVYTKACEAIRGHEEHLTNSKQAVKLKGIGKSIGACIEEFATTGMIVKLEEMRAGTK